MSKGPLVRLSRILTPLMMLLASGCVFDDEDPLPANLPPSAPALDLLSGAPDDEATGVSRAVTLAWMCSDPDDSDDSLVFDVFLGSILPPSPVADDLQERSFGTGLLEAGQQYYWQVSAADPHGGVTTSPIWSFTTAASISLCVTPSSWTVPATGGQKQVQILDCGNTSNFSFTVSSSGSWCSISLTQGTVPSATTMTAANNTTGFSRSSNIAITASGVSGSPQYIEATQASSVSPEIVVRNAWLDYPYSVAVRVCGQRYDIGPGKSVTIQMCKTTDVLCIWECPTTGCRWDCGWSVTVGNHYKVTQYGDDLRLDGD